MNLDNKKTIFVIIFASLFIVVSIMMMFSGSLFDITGKIRKGDVTKMPDATGSTEEIKSGIIIEQTFNSSTDSIKSIGIVFSRIGVYEGTHLTIELFKNDESLIKKKINTLDVESEHRTFIEATTTLNGMKNKKLKLIISSENANSGLVVLTSDTINSVYKIGDKVIKGSLCFSVNE